MVDTHRERIMLESESQILRHPILWVILTRHAMVKIDHPIRALKEAVGQYFRSYFRHQRTVILMTVISDCTFEELTVPANIK